MKSRASTIISLGIALACASCHSPAYRPVSGPNILAPPARTPASARSGEHTEVVLTTTPSGRPIALHRFRGAGEILLRPLILFSIHGDEHPAAELGQAFVPWLEEHPDLWENLEVLVLPAANPDGLARHTRTNASGVDLNRNFPSSNWRPGATRARYSPGPFAGSEIETRAIMRLVESSPPDWIISVHSPLRCVNFDGPARALAEAMAACNHYPVKESIGYPTPGSLGTYAGIDRSIPIVTLELGRSLTPAERKGNLLALAAALRLRPNRSAALGRNSELPEIPARPAR